MSFRIEVDITPRGGPQKYHKVSTDEFPTVDKARASIAQYVADEKKYREERRTDMTQVVGKFLANNVLRYTYKFKVIDTSNGRVVHRQTAKL